MRGMTKLAMAATIAVSVVLAFFLTLLLILLIDFFFSILRRKSQKTPPINNPESPNSKTPPNYSPQNQRIPKQAPMPSTLPSFYAHGVLQAPTSFLLTVPKLDQFVCVSNPVFDGIEGGVNITGTTTSTPYETPETSPSHFGEDEECSPPLKCMNKLPSISATETNRNSSCSVSSGTLCYSPSW